MAVRISKIQNRWMESLREKKNVKIVRWCIHATDLPLVNGFYKLESSSYRKIDELIVVMLTDFESSETFAYNLLKDWVAEYGKELEKCANLPWDDFHLYKERVDNLKDVNYQEKLLVELLKSYQKFIPNPLNRMFLLGILPRNLSTYEELNDWLDKFVALLSENIGITLVDYTGSDVYSSLIKKWKKDSVTIELDDMDISGAYAELMQQGNPHDPNQQIRMLVIEMGKAASKKKQKEIHVLGSRMIEIGQVSGDVNLWTYAYLVYAGFLFEFKDEQIISLLDKGIYIQKNALAAGILDKVTMLLPLYGYKASYYNFTKQYEKAFQCFALEVTTACEMNDMLGAISASKNAIIIAENHAMAYKMIELLQPLFPRFYALSDEELRTTEFFFIVFYYLHHSEEISKEEYHKIEDRMVFLFGDNWEKRSISKIGIFSNPQTIMEDAFS
ncbi:hypothetical protein DW228_18450 [Bacteroides fragilis]|uniref:Uncharacterized protein n=2 Tax=Bacteroides fragilis TaxID=817 RepID=A0A396BVW2_BACFG|nr:hypothetical protein DW228_18450 [Bacteroides fragilis]